MREETLTAESTNRRFRASTSSPILLYDYKYPYTNNVQDNTLSLRAKKIIDKYNSKSFKKDYYSNDDYNFRLSLTSRESSNEYKKYIFEEGDNYEILKNKNKNLKRLFEQANCSLILSLKKQEKLERKYEEEKKDILDKLCKIEKKYEIYAESHQKLNEITNSYNQLLALYLKVNNEIKKFKDNISIIFNNMNDFIEEYYENDSANILSFEYLLHIKNEMKDKFNIKEINNHKNNKYNNFEKRIMSNKLKTYYNKKYYNKEFTNKNDKISNKYNKSANNALINKKDFLINNINYTKNKFIDIEEI